MRGSDILSHSRGQGGGGRCPAETKCVSHNIYMTPWFYVVGVGLFNVEAWLYLFLRTVLRPIFRFQDSRIGGTDTHLRCKMTSNILQMKDDLKYFQNGRGPQVFSKWKTTSNIFKILDDLKQLKPQTYTKPKTISNIFIMEDELEYL